MAGPRLNPDCQVIAGPKTGLHARYIGPALTEVLDWAHGHSGPGSSVHLRASLLGTGRDTHFARVFSLIGMVRAFGNWRRKHTDARVRLTIHVMNVEVAYELATGRLDLLEILEAPQLRYWVEVLAPDGAVERGLAFDPDHRRLSEILDRTGVPATKEWLVEVEPDPLPRHVGDGKGTGDIDAASYSEHTLSELGVIPGSTLRLRRRGR